MPSQKRRSNIAKLITASREIWRQSENYQLVKRMARTDRPGWWRCSICKMEREAIKVDHIKAIGKQPKVYSDFGPWLEKLFCNISNHQCLCADCHKAKTKSDNKKK